VISIKKVLTIAGSDSGGGAGIQADLKTFAARGVYGMSAITALTAQNTVGVQDVLEIDANFVGKQIDSIMSDIGAKVWKIGMLSNSGIIRMVADRIKKYNIKYIVLDPVMVSKSGDPLLKREAQDALIRELIPLSYVITPNHHEAQVLAGIKIKNLEDAHTAALKIRDMGAQTVVVKGGKLPNVKDAIDIFYDGMKLYNLIAPRIETNNTHGTGCTFASAIAAELSKGTSILEAIRIAKAYLIIVLKDANKLFIGHGHGPVNHSLGCIVEAEPDSIRMELIEK
jgi:hydroxymethylpyrimidine/phosphomethylpyrimidine kinase